ncbi:hypothetical protein ACTFIW_003799 [Dictyostelium discoideum]
MQSKFEYIRIPQGLVNSPSTFARLMVEIFEKSKVYYNTLMTFCFISREKSDILKTEVDFQRSTYALRAAKVKAIYEELLSIIDSQTKFKHLLIGKIVSTYTDHQNLIYIINKSNDKPFTKRQDNYMKQIRGKKNGIADFVSRKYDNLQWDGSFLNKIKEKQINYQCPLEMKKNPNLCIEEINDIVT